MAGLYLLLLIGAISCLALIDWRYKLAYFYDARRTVLTIASGVLFFSLWDIAGIALGIFFIGDSRYLTGWGVGQYPIEEAFFLILLCYNMLLAYRFFEIRLQPSKSHAKAGKS